MRVKSSYLGKRYEGGIVFYINEVDKKGLIVSLHDLSLGIDWCNAVRICEEYRGGGYNDWHLPDEEELSLLYKYVQRNGNIREIAGFTGSYWSSAEYSDNEVWIQNFENGVGYYCGKSNIMFKVCAVRSFRIDSVKEEYSEDRGNSSEAGSCAR